MEERGGPPEKKCEKDTSAHHLHQQGSRPRRGAVAAVHLTTEELLDSDVSHKWEDLCEGDLIENTAASGYRLEGVSIVLADGLFCEFTPGGRRFMARDLERTWDSYGTVPCLPQLAQIGTRWPFYWDRAPFKRAYWHSRSVPLLSSALQPTLQVLGDAKGCAVGGAIQGVADSLWEWKVQHAFRPVQSLEGAHLVSLWLASTTCVWGEIEEIVGSGEAENNTVASASAHPRCTTATTLPQGDGGIVDLSEAFAEHMSLFLNKKV